MTITKRIVGAVCTVWLAAALLWLQKPAWAQRDAPATATPPTAADNAEFMAAADQVLGRMSALLSLPVLHPLKKSVRSRQEIHDYLIRTMKEDKDDAKRDADRKTMIALGLIPKDYPLEQKLIALLTEQIAGLYDSKSREFFIADWTSPADQETIMAHELTHALQDQHFHIDKWEDAVKSNDDASLARESVLEGSATIAMLDYALRDTGKSSRDLELGQFDPQQLLGSLDDSPELASAPLAIRDELLFPYVPGAAFSLRLLKTNGWPGFYKVFDNPPQSTQQILHPDLYFQGVMPVDVKLPVVNKILPRDWKKLDENVLGEFGVQEVFKQFLGSERAAALAPSWAGDRYALFEQERSKQTLLVIRLAFRSDADAARYFGAYSEVLEQKDKTRSNLLRRPNFFSFDTPDGGAFLRCFASQCFSAEGTKREAFDAMIHAMGWPANPADPNHAGARQILTRHPSAPSSRLAASAADYQ